MLETSIFSGRLNAPPESRHFCHIQSIMLRNLNIPVNHCFVNTFFTIHSESDLVKQKDNYLYKSDIVYHSRVRFFLFFYCDIVGVVF